MPGSSAGRFRDEGGRDVSFTAVDVDVLLSDRGPTTFVAARSVVRGPSASSPDLLPILASPHKAPSPVRDALASLAASLRRSMSLSISVMVRRSRGFVLRRVSGSAAKEAAMRSRAEI